jgi:hypothetical protein
MHLIPHMKTEQNVIQYVQYQYEYSLNIVQFYELIILIQEHILLL